MLEELQSNKTQKSVTFDLHYHTNIYRLSRQNREERLKQHRLSLQKTQANFVASTEHGYKNPLDAYLYLRDAVEDLPTHILPAVEAVSSEGVDIIFIFATEDHLRQGLKSLEPFKWSAKDINKIRDDINAINIIPHPYTPGKTGLANTLGEKLFLELQQEVDYIETHNGLSLHFLENGFKNNKLLKIPSLQKKVNYTYRLPDSLRLEHVGFAVSSDSHFPHHQEIIGAVPLTEEQIVTTENWFPFLKQKQKFKKKFLAPTPNSQWINSWNMLQSSFCTMEEAIEKRAQKFGFLKPARLQHPNATPKAP